VRDVGNNKKINMKVSKLVLLVITILFSSCQNEKREDKANKAGLNTEISFYTRDSIKIYGDLYELDKNGNTILLFHQGGSNAKGEYASIIPRLIEKGFNVLAIDQRMGGQVYGNYNRTLANIPTNGFGDGYSYCDAYTNLESALNFMIESGFNGNKVLWGSSYSASLAIQLANKRNSDVNRVLAFSPASGGPMKDCRPDEYFETLKIPLLLLRPPNEMKNESTKMQFELAQKYNHKTYVAKKGTHGSSMLVKERVGTEVEDTWKIVFSFLEEIDKE